MWHRTLRIFWWLFFIWAAVLGFRTGSLAWVILPLFSVACLFIAKDYVSKHYPSAAWGLDLTLVLLLFAYNLAFTIWPSVVRRLPLTAAALVGLKARSDLDASLALDAGPLRARNVLARYRSQTMDAEATEIGCGLDELIAKQKTGVLTPDDRIKEEQLLSRYKQLVRRSEVLRKLISDGASAEPGATGAAPPAPHSVATEPTGDIPKPVTAPISKGVRVQEGAPLPSTPVPDKVKEVQPQETAEQARLRKFESFVTRVAMIPGKPNIGLVLSSAGAPVDFSPDEALYSRLGLAQAAHFVPRIFTVSASTQAYFEGLYAGDPDLVNIASTKSGVGSILIGKLDYSFRPSSSVANDVVCDATFSYRLAQPARNSSMTDRVRVRHPSFDESHALRGALESLAGKLCDRVLQLAKM